MALRHGYFEMNWLKTRRSGFAPLELVRVGAFTQGGARSSLLARKAPASVCPVRRRLAGLSTHGPLALSDLPNAGMGAFRHGLGGWVDGV
jgi:hypothetical protein